MRLPRRSSTLATRSSKPWRHPSFFSGARQAPSQTIREPSGTAAVEEVLSQRFLARRTAHALAAHVVFPGLDCRFDGKLSIPRRCYLREERLDQVAQHAFRVAPADQREHSVRTASSGATSLTETWLSTTCWVIDHLWWKSHFRGMAARSPGASPRAFRCTHTESFIGPCSLITGCHHLS